VATLTNTSRRDVELRGMMPANHPLLDQCEGMVPRQIFQKLLIAAAEKDALSHICQATEASHPLAHSLRAMGGIEALHFLICLTRHVPTHAVAGSLPESPASPATQVAPSVNTPIPARAGTTIEAVPMQMSTVLDDEELSCFANPTST
jgi:hypothetical protein